MVTSAGNRDGKTKPRKSDKKIDKQFQAWTIRAMSLMGKIYKTFGLSQIFFTTISNTITRQMSLSEPKSFHFYGKIIITSKLWQKISIKRNIIVTSVTHGGFGQIDHQEKVEAFNAKHYLTI